MKSKSKSITRCMMLALLMVFMTAGTAFALVGGSNVPTVTSPVIVGDTGLSQSFTTKNGSTNPNSVNTMLISDMYYVTSCGNALTPALGCLPGDQEAPNTITINPLRATGVARVCTGVSFTVSPTANPNEYLFTPLTPVILGPSDGSGASPMCEVAFTVDVNAMPTKDALGATGLQTAQLARATMTDTETAETGFGAGSSTTTVLGNTPSGTNVIVTFTNGATVTYANVNSPCTTSLTEISTPTHNSPTNFRFVRGAYFDVSTDCSYTGPVTVVYPYDELAISGQERNLKLFHWKNNGWNDCTISVDTINNTITGRVTTLSPFGCGHPYSSLEPP